MEIRGFAHLAIDFSEFPRNATQVVMLRSTDGDVPAEEAPADQVATWVASGVSVEGGNGDVYCLKVYTFPGLRAGLGGVGAGGDGTSVTHMVRLA